MTSPFGRANSPAPAASQSEGVRGKGQASAAEQGFQVGEHHLLRLAAQIGRAGRVRALAHDERGLAVLVVELHVQV
jgi:hypothetical protein